MSAPMCKILILAFLFMPVTTAIDEAPCQEPLGMANGKIRKDRLLASTGNADQARLYGDRAWRADTSTGECIEVDFQHLVNVTAMAIMGNPQGSQNEYVMKYKVAYSVNKSRDGWLYITNQTQKHKVFDGNSNRFTPVFQAFQKPLHLRYIKIDTIDCYRRCALRTEFYGCNALLCQEQLGMSNAIVREDQISASSTFDDSSPNRARLFGDRSWRANSSSSEWIHVDFQHLVNITALAIQGNPVQNEFVTEFKVAFSVYDTDDMWVYVEDDGNNVKEYSGNSNRYTPVFHVFSRPIYLRYIRIDAIQCRTRCVLRLEFYGCEAAEHKVSYLDALGMANGLITEHQLSPSSARSLDPANQARLYGDRAWLANTVSNEWIEVDFQNFVTVTAMATQGRPNGNEYVIKYKVAYSVNKTQCVWMNVTDEYGNEKEFDGNNDPYTPVFQVFPSPLPLRVIRITALECENRCGLRLEFYASNDQPTTTETSTFNPSTTSITSKVFTSVVGTSASSAQPASLSGYVAGSIIGVLVLIAIATAAVICFFLRKRNRTIATNNQGNQFDGPYDLTITGEAAALESISNKQHDPVDTAENTEEDYQDIQNDENEYTYTDIQGKSKNEENSKELVNIYAKSQYGGTPPSYNVSNEGPRDNKGHQSGVREQNTEDINSDNIYQDLLDENKDKNALAYAADGPCDLNISDEVPATANLQAATIKGISEKQQHLTDTVNNTEEDYQDIHEDSNEYAYAYAADVKEEQEDEGWVDNTVYATSNDEKGRLNQAETELAETEEGWEDNSLYAITSNDDQADHNNTHNSQDEGWEDNAIYAS